MPVWKEIRLPGIGKAATGREYRFMLPRGGEPAKIVRAAFEGELGMSKSSLLTFNLHTPTSRWMFPNLIRGDFGFPVIVLKNSRGTTFRFNRGNLKDFFDINRPNSPQRIALPVSSFVYQSDSKTNVPDDGWFFAHGITGIYFDFLCHPEHEIDISLDALDVENQSGQTSLDARDLIVFERTGQAKQLPTFSTETTSLSFGLSLSNTAIALGYTGGTLRLTVLGGGVEGDSCENILGMETTYVQLRLPRPGPYLLRATLDCTGCQPVTTTWPVCRLLPRSADGKATCLGMSDQFEYDRIAAIGGSWDRLVIGLQGIIEDTPSRFRFAHGASYIPVNPCGRDRFRTFAPAGMPKWLSSRPELPDYHCYAPRDWEKFRELVVWLARKLKASGATHYEVWNESSVSHSWNEDLPTLVKLHRVSYEAVKSVDPHIQVLGGCSHSWTFDYLNRFLEAGGAAFCDGLAVHGYTYQPHEFVSQFDRLEEIIDGFASDRPDFLAHITEIGFRYPAFSLDAQAKCLALYTLEAAARRRVGAVLWFRHTNPRAEILSGYRQNSSTGYALVGHGNSYCRPSLAAYRFIERLLQVFDRIEASGTGEGRWYHFYRQGEVKAIAGYKGPTRSSGWPMFDQYGAESNGMKPDLCFEISPDMLHHFR